MDLTETLRRLEAAKGDPNALALATVDIVLASHGPALKIALEAAAVPHWFDEPMLRAMLGDAVPNGSDWFDQLVRLTMVERFQAHGAWNVHEVTRLALRNRIREDHPERFRALSEKAASIIEGDGWAQTVERIYHLLSADPDQGADNLRRLWKQWVRAGKLQPLQALAKNLDELRSRNLLTPRTKAYALVALGVIRRERIDVRASEEMAREAVELMTRANDAAGLVDAYVLLGEVLRDRGRLADALSACESAQANLELRAKLNGDEAELADEQAGVHEGIGRTLKDRGQWREALTEAETVLNIRQQLSDLDPGNGLKRYLLAVARADVGDALLPTSRAAEAESHFVAALYTAESVLADGSGPETIEQDIGRLKVRLGDLYLAQGNPVAAMQQYENTGEIFSRLTKEDPEHLTWKAEVALVHARIGNVELTRAQLDSCEQRLAASREIYADLAERDPSNPRWKQSLGWLSSLFGILRDRQGRWADASKEHLAAEQLLVELTKLDPDRADWKLALASAQNGAGRFLQKLQDALEDKDQKVTILGLMAQKFTAARNTLAELAGQDPGNLEVRSAFGWSERLLAGAVETIADHIDAGLELGLGMSAAELRDRAFGSFISSASIFADLSKQSPDNADFRRDFSISTLRTGKILKALGYRTEALSMFKTSLATTEELTRLDPTNAVWADDLVYVRELIGQLENAKPVEDKHNSN